MLEQQTSKTRREAAHRRRQAVERATEMVRRSLEPLDEREIEILMERMEQTTSRTATSSKQALVRSLAGRDFTVEDRVQLEHLGLLEHFRRRRELLEGALTSAQVAELLGASRQTPYDRVKSGSLLGILDRGILRFPAWQFDPENSDGVVAGLPRVIRALRVSPLEKISWLTKANSILDGATPLEALKAGQVDRVAELAQSVART